jgi:hypothetical protein
MISFVLVGKNATFEMLGFVPSFFDLNDPRPAKEQVDENYQHGGGWYPMQKVTAVPEIPFAFKYPGDPVFLPMAIAKLRSEIIVLYHAGFLGIWQRDGSFEISRVD